MRSIPYKLLRHFPLLPLIHWRLARLLNDRFLLGVMGIIRDDYQRVLLFHHTYRRQPWGLPGGWMNRGETPLEAIEREVREESGFVVEATGLLMIGTTADRPKLEFVVGARIVGGEFRPSHEVSAAHWWQPGDPIVLPRQQLEILQAAGQLDAGELRGYPAPWRPDFPAGDR